MLSELQAVLYVAKNADVTSKQAEDICVTWILPNSR